MAFYQINHIHIFVSCTVNKLGDVKVPCKNKGLYSTED